MFTPTVRSKLHLTSSDLLVAKWKHDLDASEAAVLEGGLYCVWDEYVKSTREAEEEQRRRQAKVCRAGPLYPVPRVSTAARVCVG